MLILRAVALAVDALAPAALVARRPSVVVRMSQVDATAVGADTDPDAAIIAREDVEEGGEVRSEESIRWFAIPGRLEKVPWLASDAEIRPLLVNVSVHSSQCAEGFELLVRWRTEEAPLLPLLASRGSIEVVPKSVP